MRWLILAWKQDPAAKGMFTELEFCLDIDAEMVLIDENPLFLSQDNFAKDERLIVLSKHASSKGIPALTVHSPGNWTKENRLGGEKEKVSYCDPLLNSLILRELDLHTSLAGIKNYYDVVFEATHHGPTLDVPVTFVEIGSTSKEWNDKRAQQVAARAVNAALKKYAENKLEGYIGVGGPHYARIFTVYCTEKGYNIGHIIPKYALEIGNFERMILLAQERTLGCKGIIVEWKSLKKEQKTSLQKIAQDKIIKIK
ncbi:MAG: hypothetical protein GXO42_03220 [bacterium]|nr:hypothetical protein [bacterium]